jgi:hypothetical protein
MQRSRVQFNYRPFLTVAGGVFIIVNSLLLAASELLDFEITSTGWTGLLIVEALSVLSGFTLFKWILTPKLDKEPALYKQKQGILLQQLKQASDPHTRQVILDRMMSEDLLRGVDLSHTTLREIHLESANLENADLCRCVLPEADLEGANLQRALLSEADLTNADLMNADLRGTQLNYIQFDGATLANANLNGADLQYAGLQGASLYDAELDGAHLDYADLRGCCLLYANLLRATLNSARFDETTILPDGEKWTPMTDLRRFTDDTHPQFVSYQGPDATASREISTSAAD